MAIDGISLSNLGRPKESTTADLIEKTEQDAQKGEGIIKELDNISKRGAISSRKKRGSSKQDGQFEDGLPQNDTEDNEENPTNNEQNESLSNPEKIINIEDADYRSFYVKINSENDMVELYDKDSNKLIETIPAQDLMVLMQKMNTSTGIFVNKKV